jgi:hypothetical protein
MVQNNAVMFGWNRPVVGREGMAGELFAHTMGYLEKLRTSSLIESYEPVVLDMHGGDLNGFIMIKGSHAQLDAMLTSDEFVDITLRAGQYLTNVGVITAHSGLPVVQNLMGLWMKTIPAQR